MKPILKVFLLLLLLDVGNVAGQYRYHLMQTGDDVDDNIKAAVELEGVSVQSRLQSTIDDISGHVELTEMQLKKLKVAAKGAYKKWEKSRTEEIEKQCKQFEGQVVTFAVVVGITEAVDDQEFWKLALDKTLSDEQKSQLNDWRDKRNAFLRKCEVMKFVGDLDRKLFLTLKQRDTLTEIIDKEFGEKLAKAGASNDWSSQQVSAPPEPEFLHLVEDLLSEHQINEWKASVEFRLQQINNR